MSLMTDELFYIALKRDAAIVLATKGRIFPTCIEVPPMDQDKTALPYIIVNFEGGANDTLTKDDPYEGESDDVTVSVEVVAKSRKEVGRLLTQARQCIHDYICGLAEDSKEAQLRPDDYVVSFSPVVWDWTKPCYYQTLTYRCSTKNEILKHGEKEE